MTNFVRLPEVCKRYSVSKSTIYRLIQQGSFPSPVKLGARASAWAESALAEHDRKLLGGVSK